MECDWVNYCRSEDEGGNFRVPAVSHEQALYISTHAVIRQCGGWGTDIAWLTTRDAAPVLGEYIVFSLPTQFVCDSMAKQLALYTEVKGKHIPMVVGH